MQLVVPSAVSAAVPAAIKMRRRTSHTEFFFIAIFGLNFVLVIDVSILAQRVIFYSRAVSVFVSRRAAEFRRGNAEDILFLGS